jgi:hypothetical protein
MSEELLAALIREWWGNIQDKDATLTQLAELKTKLNTPTKPVSYDEAIVLEELRNDWQREFDILMTAEMRISNDMADTLVAIGEIVPTNIPITISVDDKAWVVQKFSEGSVEVRGHGS